MRVKVPFEHVRPTSVPHDRDDQAWRRTIAGWCFAIGAAGPPPDQWLDDGPNPPRGFPGEDPEWGRRFGIDARNW